MPLSRQALALGPSPLGAQQARRWVMQICSDIGRPDLLESARLGVSELVTNAVLHGTGPIEVRVRGTEEFPRVEVRDRSLDLPTLPDEDAVDGGDNVLLTFGRGLGLVARASLAWGTEVEIDGKVVWFVPSSGLHDSFVQGVVTGATEPKPRRTPQPGDVHVQVLGVPPDLYRDFLHHNRELRREVRLLALAHAADYPIAKTLSDHFDTLETGILDGIGIDALDDAVGPGGGPTDVHAGIPRETAAMMVRFLELLDLADAFCREERLLTLARTPVQRHFQQWMLGEFVRQSRSEPPISWQDAPMNVERRTL